MKIKRLENQKKRGLEDLIVSVDKQENVSKEEKRRIYDPDGSLTLNEKDSMESNFGKGYELGRKVNMLDNEDIIERVNSILINSFELLEKDKFNSIVRDWTERYIEPKEKELFEEKEPGRIIEKYHNIFSNYFDNNISIEREDDYIEVEMKEGCPYGRFCEETGNKKCIRGTVFKYLLDETENNGDAWNTPILEKDHSEDRSCKVKLYKDHNDLIDSFMNPEELGKKKNAL